MKNLQDEKQRDLSINKSDGTNKFLTTNQGVRINDDNNSLKAGRQGSFLLKDFTLREKITHFDHEHILEKIARAHNSGTNGFFEFTDPEPRTKESSFQSSDALSMLKNPTNSPSIAYRKVAIICTDGVSEAAVTNIQNAILKENAKGLIVAPHLGSVLTDENGAITVDFSFLDAKSVLFDAVYIPHGLGFGTLLNNYDVLEFLNEAYKHCKVIGADGKATELIQTAPFASKMSKDDAGIILTKDIASETFAQNFIAAIGKHRFWEREPHLYS